MYQNELRHFGIKGMRWGRRKNQTSASKSSKTTHPKAETHEDHKKAHTPKALSSMSDAELRSRLNRLDMESRYKKLPSNRVRTGKDYVQDAIKVGTTVATLTGTALTIYNNFDKIKGIANKVHA